MPSTPEPLPSIPPSPTPPKDIAHAWHDDDPDEDEEEPSGSDSKVYLSAASAKRKGKEKAVSRGRSPGRGGSDDDEEEENGAVEGYPPTKEEEAESRKIEENLRRWEIAERQRRKAARESTASTAPSLLSELRSSLFRRDSSRKVPLGGVGTHHALRTDDRDADPDPADDGVPLEDMRTPTGEAFSAPPTPEPENPFDTPMASRTSLNIPADSAIMTESDSIPADFAEGAEGAAKRKKGKGPNRPMLEASTSFAPVNATATATAKKQPPPPPQPLDIPPPRSPPPRTGTPQAGKPPEPIPPPVPEPAPREPEPIPDGPPVRWWHEWLCGCGEGPDRGGDHQAGRTNPFE
ncbi:hypothetical protein C8Q73DRAFT_789960 [Cubamyces lactineus]|nr:hypothetical protein C8Q73DRAFT_789960 [Cubamyces lactineus]